MRRRRRPAAHDRRQHRLAQQLAADLRQVPGRRAVAAVDQPRRVREVGAAQPHGAGAGVHARDERGQRAGAHIGQDVGRIVAGHHQQPLQQRADLDPLFGLEVDAGLADPQPRVADRDRCCAAPSAGPRPRRAVIILVRLAIGRLEVRPAHPHHAPGPRVDHDAPADADALHLGGRRVRPVEGRQRRRLLLARGLGCPCPPSERERLGDWRHDGAQRLACSRARPGPCARLPGTAPRRRRRRRRAAPPPSAAGAARDGNATGEAARRRRAGQTSVQ